MTRTTKSSMVMLLAVAAVVLAGTVFATARGARAPERLGSSASAGAHESELAAALAALRAEIATLRETLAASPAATVVHEAARAPEGGDERLAAAIEALVDRLGARSTAPHGDDDAAGAPGSLDVAAIDAPTGEQRAARIAELRATAPEARLPAHFLWSARRIVERYGIPDSVYTSPEGEVSFCYQRSESEPQIGFSFADGVVVRAWGE